MKFDSLGNIVFRNRLYSSIELRKWIDTIKANLFRTINEGSIVGIYGERNEKLICIMFACIECNITFIPIDKDMPPDRLEYMMDKAKARYLITNIDTIKHNLDKKIICINIHELLVKRESFDDSNLSVFVNRPVYILYTSGSTGRPKGVMISYESFENFLTAIPQIIPFGKKKNIACFTSISFDISLMEIVLGLKSGMNLILADDSERTNPKSLIKLINNYGIDVLQMTPSMLKMLQICNNNKLDFLKNVESLLLGGEKLSDELLDDLHRDITCKIYNMYGPTETTIWSTVSDLSNNNKSNIGKPILNTTIYIVDENNQPVEPGFEGELLIGGKGLAIGYVDEPELTKESFIYLNTCGNERVYRTGDICKVDALGNLLYIGRIDTQVKINGHRIELEEIEYAIKKHEEVIDAIVCNDNDTLICFYKGDYDLAVSHIKENLCKLLPKYMIPAIFHRVDEFEYTISNKVDRKQLLKNYRNRTENVPSTEKLERNNKKHIEETIIKLFAERTEIAIQDVEISMTFEESGINSISFVEFIVAIEELFDFEFEEKYLNVEEFSSLGEVITYVRKRIII